MTLAEWVRFALVVTFVGGPFLFIFAVSFWVIFMLNCDEQKRFKAERLALSGAISRGK